MPTVTFTLNGKETTAAYEPGMHFLEVLREECGITSVKDGCSPQGFCGCCTILVDSRPALACLKKPEQVSGASVTTLEGLPEATRRLIAESFVREGGVQCGYCVPGVAMRTASLLSAGHAHEPEAVRNALSAHLCRCTGYARIEKGILAAGEAARAGEGIPPGREGEDVVGGSAARYRGREMVLGAKPFVGDMKLPGMLHAAVVLSPHPRARLLSVDASAAPAAPGGARAVAAADVPGERTIGLITRDWPVFVAPGEETRCLGDVLAVVVADTQFHARQAAKLVKLDCEVLPPVTSPEEALAPGAPKIHPGGNLLDTCAFGRGDVDAALASSAHVVSRRFTTQRIEHAFLEPEACLATPLDSGGVKVYSQGQGVHDDQLQIAAILGLPRGSVDVELVTNGGAFGGKEDLSIQGQTALAAVLAKAPVRLVLTREQSILLHPKRHPLTLDYTVGCDAEGRLTAVRARIVGDTGAYASVGAKVLERAAGHSCGPYFVPNVDVEAKTVYTNNLVCGAMRGFGVNQAAFAIEGCLDILAETVGLDGYDMRERNLLDPGKPFATGQLMDESCGVRRTLEAVRDVYRSAKYAGIACGIKNTGIGNGMQDIGRVRILVGAGGRLEIQTGYTEMGQGLHTVLSQVVAGETGLPIGTMTVRTVSDLAVLSGMTTASRATALGSTAACFAARELAAALKDAPVESLSGKEFRGEFIVDFTVKPGTDVPNPVTHMTFGYATQVVILDEEGKLAKVVAAHDVGRAMNPDFCRAQIEGAVHMGLGFALSEDLPVHGGRPDSTLLRDLGILKARETPEVEVILIEVPDKVGAYGAKGVGEIGLVPTAAAVQGALFAFDRKRRFSLPMTAAPAARGLVPASRAKAHQAAAVG